LPCPSILPGHCGDGMKPQSRLLEFYKDNLVRFEHLRTLPSSFDKDIEKILQGSSAAWPRLAKLCGSNKELMFGILGGFLALKFFRDELKKPIFRQLEKDKKTKKKNLKRNVENYIKRLTKESLDHIKRAKSLDLDIDEGKLRERAKAWISYKAQLRFYEMDKYDDAINFVFMIDPDIDYSKLKKNMHDSYRQKIGNNETSVSFNDYLCSIYLTCKSRTELSDNAIYEQISNLLNSFKIKSKTGKPFTTKNVQGRIKRAS
jgi:hypothetical protein